MFERIDSGCNHKEAARPSSWKERSIAPTGVPDHRPQSANGPEELLPDALSLAQASRLLPGRPHPSTLWRWRKKGVRGIKLKTVQIGGRVWVTRSAIADFAVRCRPRARQPPGAEARRKKQSS